MSLTEFLYVHPDKFLAVVGGLGGLTFGLASLGWLEGFLAAAMMAVFTYAVSHIDHPSDYHHPKE